MENRIVVYALTVVVAISIIAGAMVPVIEEMAHDTGYNTDCYWRATADIDDYEYTISDGDLLLNGETVTVNSDSPRAGVSSPVLGVAYTGSTYFWAFGGTDRDTSTAEVTIAADGSWSYVDSSSNTTSSTSDTVITTGLFANDSGEYAVYRSASATEFKVNEGTAPILFTTYSQVTDGDSNTYGFTYRATLDGSTVNVEYANIWTSDGVVDVSDDVVFTLGSIETSTSSGITDYSNVVCTVSLGGDYADYSVNINSLIAVPYQYDTENDYATILFAVPLVVLVALIAVAVPLLRAKE